MNKTEITTIKVPTTIEMTQNKAQRIKSKYMNKQLTFTIIFLLFNAFALQDQKFGGHPSSVKWKQINSENVRDIFPEGLDSNAMRIADVIEYMYPNKQVGI